MEEIRKLLEAPDDTKDEFWDSGELIWIDWRTIPLSTISIKNCRTRIKFSLNAWNQRKSGG